MKKLLSMLSIAGIIGSSSMSVISCGTEDNNLSSVLTVTDLVNVGAIADGEVPSYESVLAAVKWKNPDIDETKLSFAGDITATGATLVSDGPYSGEVSVTFTTLKTQVISDGEDLGTISIAAGGDDAVPTDEELMTAVFARYTNLSPKDSYSPYIKVKSKFTNGASLSIDNSVIVTSPKGTGLQVIYTVAPFTLPDLNTVLTNTELGNVLIVGTSNATEASIKTAIELVNTDINVSYLKIDAMDVGTESATVKPDDIHYTGDYVNVSFSVLPEITIDQATAGGQSTVVASPSNPPTPAEVLTAFIGSHTAAADYEPYLTISDITEPTDGSHWTANIIGDDYFVTGTTAKQITFTIT